MSDGRTDDVVQRARVLAIQNWNGLSRGERREVVKNAKNGIPHPNPRVREIATRWADVTLSGGSKSDRRSQRWANLAYLPFAAAIGVLLDDSGVIIGGALGVGWGQGVRDRRLARKIAKVAGPGSRS
jgi:hypothetical protein